MERVLCIIGTLVVYSEAMLGLLVVALLSSFAQGLLAGLDLKYHGRTHFGGSFTKAAELSMSSSVDYLESLSKSSSPRVRRYNRKVEVDRERPSKSLGVRGFSSSKVAPKSSKTRRTAQSQRKNKFSQQNSNDVEVGRVSVYCLGASVDLNALRSHIFRRSFDNKQKNDGDMSLSATGNNGDDSDKIEDDVLHISNGSSDLLWQEFSQQVGVDEGSSNEEIDWNLLGQRVMSSQDIFYYDYGCVVMWGLSPNEEMAALEELKEFVTEIYSDEELDESCDTLEFVFDHNVNPKRPVRFDRMRLRSLKIQEKLALSYAMAQSSKLFVFESKVLNSLEETRDLPRELAEKGMISCSKRDLNMLIGQLFVEQTEVNLFSNILDTPDFLWEDDEHTPAYSYLRGYLEVDERVDLLNSRLSVMRELLDVLTAQVENSNSSRLEWIIIFLIAVEIVLGILSNPLFAGKRFISSMTVPAAILAFKGGRMPTWRERSRTNL